MKLRRPPLPRSNIVRVAVSLVFILFLAGLVYMKIKQIESPHAAEP